MKPDAAIDSQAAVTPVHGASAPTPRKGPNLLTDEQITHLWDTRVGEAHARYPITVADGIIFARAIEAAILAGQAAASSDHQTERLRGEPVAADGGLCITNRTEHSNGA